MSVDVLEETAIASTKSDELAESLIVEHLDLWSSTIKAKNSVGRGGSKKVELYGVKKLRELILELAVRGKLVPQDPNDEPAIVLLEKIAEEKDLLVSEGKIKKQKPLPPISEEERPFELPVGWIWAKLGTLSSEIHYGYTASANHDLSSVRLLRITDIQDDKVNWSTVPGCEISDAKAKSYLLENEDILIARTGGTIGKSYLVENISVDAVFASYLIRVRRVSVMYASFIKVYLGSNVYWNQLYANSAGTGQPNVNATALKSMLVPIPPKSEQFRIVTKVNELMALCDQLEQNTEASLDAHKRLVDTLLKALIDPEQDLQQNWRRIEEHFDTLITTEYAVEQLKQTILQLAVMGKLVPQNPNDEPASVLLKKIAEEKARLVKEKKIKKQKPLPPISDEEKPFELPEGWEWCYLSDIACFENGDRSSRYPNNSDLVDHGVPFFGAPDIQNGILSYRTELRFITDEKFSELSNGKLVDRDFVVLLRGSVGKTAQFHVNDKYDTGFINAQMLIIRLIDVFLDGYLKIYFETEVFNNYIAEQKSGAVIQQLPAGKIAEAKIPFPPEKERLSMIAKVNELMTLCDTMLERIQAAQTTQLKLTDAITQQALSE